MRFHAFIQDVLADKASVACLKHLQLHPHATGRELAKIAQVSQFKIRSLLQELTGQGLLKVQALGKAHLYSLNHQHYIAKKILPLLEQEEQFLSFFGQWVMQALSSFQPLSLVLYGSVARQEERPNSDVDLLLLYQESDLQKIEQHALEERLSKSVMYFGNRISVLTTSPSAWKKKIKARDPFFMQIFKQGKVIAGLPFSEVFHECKEN